MRVKLDDPRVTVLETYGPYVFHGNLCLRWAFPEYEQVNKSGGGGTYEYYYDPDNDALENVDYATVALYALRLLTYNNLTTDEVPPYLAGGMFNPSLGDPDPVFNENGGNYWNIALTADLTFEADEYVYNAWQLYAPYWDRWAFASNVYRHQAPAILASDSASFSHLFKSYSITDGGMVESAVSTVATGSTFPVEVSPGRWLAVPYRRERKTKTYTYTGYALWDYLISFTHDSFGAKVGERRCDTSTVVVETYERNVVDGNFYDPEDPGVLLLSDGTEFSTWGLTWQNIDPLNTWEVTTTVDVANHDSSVQEVSDTSGPFKKLRYVDGDFEDISIYEQGEGDWWESTDGELFEYHYSLNSLIQAYDWGIATGLPPVCQDPTKPDIGKISRGGAFETEYSAINVDESPFTAELFEPTFFYDPGVDDAHASDPPYYTVGAGSVWHISVDFNSGSQGAIYAYDENGELLFSDWEYHSRVRGGSWTNPIYRKGDIEETGKIRASLDAEGNLFVSNSYDNCVYRRKGVLAEWEKFVVEEAAIPRAHDIKVLPEGRVRVRIPSAVLVSEDDAETWQLLT